MKFYGKAEAIATHVLTVFQSGELPKALAPIFIHRRDNVPCRAWSWSNQMITALSGTSDARGFRQWQAAGRKVCKGAKAFHILAPCTGKRTVTDDDGERDAVFLFGFRSVPVFALESTEIVDSEKWSEATADDQEAREFIDGLPVVSVARSWGLSVEAFNGEHARYLGRYRHKQSIALGVKNLATWTHELIHAADDRCIGGLKGGQQLDQEVVAELGGAVLLQCLGYETDADLGGAWRYVQSYCQRAKKPAIAVCQQFLDRVCNAVALVLDTADKLNETESVVAA